MENYNQVPETISVESFLYKVKEVDTDIIVKEKEEVYDEVYLKDKETDFRKNLLNVQIERLDDFQKLSLLPQGIEIGKLKDAIERDTDEALNVFKKQYQFQSDCDCSHSHATVSPETQYNSIRSNFHQNLSNLLSSYYKRKLRWDSFEVKQIYKIIHKSDMFGKVFKDYVPIALYRDIFVYHHGILNISQTSNVLWAKDIKIYVGAKIVVKSSHLRIKCASLQGNIQ